MTLATGTGDAEPVAVGLSLAAEVVENIGVVVFRRVQSPGGRISYPYLSAGAEHLLRIPRDRFVALAGSGDSDSLLHPDDRPSWRAAIARSAETLSPLSFEGRVLWPDGTARWIRVTAAAHRERNGAIAWDGIALDVTEQKEAEQERARLASIVEASGDAIYSWAIDGTIISWNPEAERLFGWPASEAIGRSFRMLIPPERDISADEVVRQLIGGRTFRQFQTVRLHRDGRRLEVSLTVSPLSDRTGRIVAVSTIARDISQRRAAEEALRLSEERFRTTLSSIGDAVVATDRDARVSFLNPIAEELTGWSAAEAVGRPLPEIVQIMNEAKRAPVENPVARVLHAGRVVGLANHMLLVRRDGERGADRRQRGADPRWGGFHRRRGARLPRRDRGARAGVAARASGARAGPPGEEHADAGAVDPAPDGARRRLG